MPAPPEQSEPAIVNAKCLRLLKGFHLTQVTWINFNSKNLFYQQPQKIPQVGNILAGSDCPIFLPEQDPVAEKKKPQPIIRYGLFLYAEPAQNESSAFFCERKNLFERQRFNPIAQRIFVGASAGNVTLHPVRSTLKVFNQSAKT